jgi:adenine-specific DNA glycosylase
VVEEEDGAVLLFRRADGEELLAGTWELPWVDAGQPAALTREELASGLARRYGGRWSIRERLGQVRHGITFRDLRVEVWRARLSWERVGEAPVGVAGVRFFLTEEISAVAVSSLVRKALGLLGEGAPVSRGRSRRRPG